MNNITISMPCLFGVESILADEVRFVLGKTAVCETGRVSFEGTMADLYKANLWMRTAERVQIRLGSFPAPTFDALFEGMKALPLENYIPRDGAFPVKGYSRNSKLTSIPDCQKILKKASVERLKAKYGVAWFEETGATYQLSFAIMKDVATLYLDSTGDPLHKRGYRREGGVAPIKETLAAAIADCARVKFYHRVIDPCCGSGTLLIEAAMKALNMAPGLNRHFAFERWEATDRAAVAGLRDEARSVIKTSDELICVGRDIDPEALSLTMQNAKNAGVDRYFTTQLSPIADFVMPTDDKKNILLANPPYGERLLDHTEANAIYQQMGQVFTPKAGTGAYIISPEEEFEKAFGRPAMKRRKLYNGMLKCWLYMY